MGPGSLDRGALCAAFYRARCLGKSALLLTGPIGSGKTLAASILANALWEKGFAVAGILSPRILRNGETVGYVVRDVRTGRSLPLCAISPHELFLLVKTISPSSSPSPPPGGKGFSLPNSLGLPVEEGDKENVPRGPPPQPFPQKGEEPTERVEDKANLSPFLLRTFPFRGDHFFVPLETKTSALAGIDFSAIPSPLRGEGKGEGEIFQFRRFFFSQRALEFGNSVLKKAAEKAKVIVVDEVGPLELSGRGFAPGLRACREAQAFLILTVRPHLLSPVKKWLSLENAEVFSLRGEEQE